MKSSWLQGINDGAMHLSGTIVFWVGAIVGAFVLLRLVLWMLKVVFRKRGTIGTWLTELFKTLGSAAGTISGGASGTARTGTRRSLLGISAAFAGIILAWSMGVNPFTWFVRGSGWGWLALFLLASVAVAYYSIGAAKSWGTKLVGFTALSCCVAVLASLVRDNVASALAQAPLVAEAGTVGTNDAGYHFTIPMKIRDQPVLWNNREVSIPPHTTVGVRAEGYVNYDPTGGTLKELERKSPEFVRQHPELLQEGAFTVTPDGGMIEPDLMGSRDGFPLRNGWVGRPYVRLGNGPAQVVTSMWTEVTNATNRSQPLRVGLNLSTSMRQWTTGDEGRFTLFVRGIALPR